MKVTRAKTGSRRAHHGLTSPALVRDAKSGSVRRRHFIDPQTGKYRGKELMPVRAGSKAEAGTAGKKQPQKSATTEAPAVEDTSSQSTAHTASPSSQEKSAVS